jgi:hypothetical protein
MAIVSKVITPLFFSEKEPYMFVRFVEEFESRFRTGSCENPSYIQVYDLMKIYPDLKNVYEAKTRFIEEMKVGNHEPVNLHEFKISDLTNGNHLAIRGSYSNNKETHLRVGVYDDNNEREVAVRMLYFCIDHRFFKWDDL